MRRAQRGAIKVQDACRTAQSAVECSHISVIQAGWALYCRMSQPQLANPFAAFKCRKVASHSAASNGTSSQNAAPKLRRKPAVKRKAAAESVVTAQAASVAPKGVPELLGDAPLRLILVGQSSFSAHHIFQQPSSMEELSPKQLGAAPVCLCIARAQWCPTTCHPCRPQPQRSRLEERALLLKPIELDVAAAKGHRHCAAEHPRCSGGPLSYFQCVIQRHEATSIELLHA